LLDRQAKQLKIIKTHNSRYVSKEIGSGFFSESEEKRKAFIAFCLVWWGGIYEVQAPKEVFIHQNKKPLPF
jgi:hypothetical protein